VLELIKQANIGSIVPVYKEFDEINALEYFAKLSNYGKKKHSLFFESEGKSFGSVDPCLVVSGKGADFEIKALNNRGKRILNFIKKDFGFCDKAVYKKDKIQGMLTSSRRASDEKLRLKLKNHLDILRVIAFKFKAATNSFEPNCGLFGMVSYDFIDSIEDMPRNKEDANEPDYVVYYIDNMFVTDYEAKKTFFVANALITDNKKELVYKDCCRTIRSYEKLISTKATKVKKPKKKELKISYDADNGEFLAIMKDLKRQIEDGSILSAEPSRTVKINSYLEPLDVYTYMRHSSKHAFYINDECGISIGCNAKVRLGVKERAVELKAVTAAWPVAAKEGNDIDAKYEVLLKSDENEIAYHIMMADAARDEIARISDSAHVSSIFFVEKNANSLELTLRINGELKEGLDAMHVFSSVMNFGVGLPKVRAMQLLRGLERTKRCFNDCSFVCISPNGDFSSIRASPLRLNKNILYFGETSRVFNYNSNSDELRPSEDRAKRILNALKSGELL
jgi:anthranilate synthase component I